MSAQILDGIALSKLIYEDMRPRVARLAEVGVVPRLDVLVASQDPASVSYVKMKRKRLSEVGMAGETYDIDENTTQEELIDRIVELNEDPKIHGILIQHPLPKHLDENAALLALGADKDVDGIAPQSLGRLVADLPGFRCATPLGITRFFDYHDIEIQGKHALVVGRSVILGKPMALMLLQRNATVTIAHSRTMDLPALCSQADILVAAVGKPELIRGSWIKPGAVVIDAGYNRVEGRSGDVGDVAFDEALQVAGWITPVPGGVGPMTVASLLSNVLGAAEDYVRSHLELREH